MTTEQITHNGLLLSETLDDMLQLLQDVASTKVSMDYNGFIGSNYDEFNMTLSNGTFSATPSIMFNQHSCYIISITYTNGNALADRTLYVLRINKDKTLQTTLTLVGGKTANDSLLVTYRNNAFTFASTYSGNASGCTVKII